MALCSRPKKGAEDELTSAISWTVVELFGTDELDALRQAFLTSTRERSRITHHD